METPRLYRLSIAKQREASTEPARLDCTGNAPTCSRWGGWRRGNEGGGRDNDAARSIPANAVRSPLQTAR